MGVLDISVCLGLCELHAGEDGTAVPSSLVCLRVVQHARRS